MIVDHRKCHMNLFHFIRNICNVTKITEKIICKHRIFTHPYQSNNVITYYVGKKISFRGNVH